MKNKDILLRLSYLSGFYSKDDDTMTVLQDAITEIQYLRKTARLSDSILDNPHAGVNGWGKGRDE